MILMKVTIPVTRRIAGIAIMPPTGEIVLKLNVYNNDA